MTVYLPTLIHTKISLDDTLDCYSLKLYQEAKSCKLPLSNPRAKMHCLPRFVQDVNLQ